MSATTDHAGRLFQQAEKDFKALLHMLDRGNFADEVFGFHLQQAAEKALKAWLARSNIQYPKTHDMGRLLQLLKDSGENIDSFSSLLWLTEFAVDVRYEGFESGEEALDREASIAEVKALLDCVRRVLSKQG